jgi:nicotinate-nucleotide pyrophosphorylase
MLDNMDDETMKKAVELINKKALVEASGNMTLERIKSVAQTGLILSPLANSQIASRPLILVLKR